MSQVGPDTGAVRPRPRGLRRYLPLAVAAWVVLEIWLLILLAEVIGGFGVLCYLVVSALLGGWVIKRAGLKALRATTAGLRGGAYPAEGGDPIAKETRTAVTIAGGLLLVLPGILSELLALGCLFPPTAGLLRRLPERWLRRPGTPLGDAFRLQEQLRIHRPDGKVVQGEVVDPPAEDPLRKRDDPYGYGGSRDQLD